MILFKIVYFSLLYVFPISIPNILVSISSDVKRFDMIPSILSVIITNDNLITITNETSITSGHIMKLIIVAMINRLNELVPELKENQFQIRQVDEWNW